MPDGARLDSWKEIARYLGRDVRTVIRWEDRGLPVHRVPGGKVSRVFAFTQELDAWLAHGDVGTPTGEPETHATATPRQPEPGTTPSIATDAEPRRRPVVRTVGVATVIVLIAALVAAWAVVRSETVPDRLEVSGGQLLAYEAGATRPAWTKRLPDGDMSTSWGRWNAIGDLDNDGARDIITAVEVHQPRSNEHTGMLSRLSASGQARWQLVADDRVRFRDREYGPPWPTDDFALYGVGGDTRIAWTVHQFTWWPGLLISVDANGVRRGRFVNSGWLRAVQPSRDGRFLFVSGISNSHHAYILAVLDARDPTGHSPEPAGSEMECVGCPQGQPLHYFVFPRTDLGLTQPFPARGPSIETFEDGSVQVETHESDVGAIGTILYTFSPDAVLREARFNDAYWDQHRRVGAAALTHNDAECPERRGLAVRHWTPGGGWETVQIVPR